MEINNDWKFTPLVLDHFNQIAPGDQTSIIGWYENNYTSIIVGSANYEKGSSNAPSAYYYKIFENGAIESGNIPGVSSTTGPRVILLINCSKSPEMVWV